VGSTFTSRSDGRPAGDGGANGTAVNGFNVVIAGGGLFGSPGGGGGSGAPGHCGGGGERDGLGLGPYWRGIGGGGGGGAFIPSAGAVTAALPGLAAEGADGFNGAVVIVY
jgi:hypothetical protein